MYDPIKIAIRKSFLVRVGVRVRVRDRVNQKRYSFRFKNDSCTLIFLMFTRNRIKHGSNGIGQHMVLYVRKALDNKNPLITP